MHVTIYFRIPHEAQMDGTTHGSSFVASSHTAGQTQQMFVYRLSCHSDYGPKTLVKWGREVIWKWVCEAPGYDKVQKSRKAPPLSRL